MSTVYTGLNYIKRLRKRLAKGTTSYNTSDVFGEEWRKELDIPDFIHYYNTFMHSVDIADQFRSFFKISRKCYRTWKPLFYFLLDQAIVNAFRLSAWCNLMEDIFKDHNKHFKFHRDLAVNLMGRC